MDQISAPSFFHGHDGLWFYSSGTSDSIKKGNHHLPGMYRSRLMKKTEKRRHIIQLIATIVTNGYLVGFMQGEIQSGGQKFVCVPGLNCYSCPGGHVPLALCRRFWVTGNSNSVIMYLVFYSLSAYCWAGWFVVSFVLLDFCRTYSIRLKVRK